MRYPILLIAFCLGIIPVFAGRPAVQESVVVPQVQSSVSAVATYSVPQPVVAYSVPQVVTQTVQVPQTICVEEQYQETVMVPQTVTKTRLVPRTTMVEQQVQVQVQAAPQCLTCTPTTAVTSAEVCVDCQVQEPAAVGYAVGTESRRIGLRDRVRALRIREGHDN